MIDLVDEFEVAVDAIDDGWAERLCEAGVPREVFCDPLPLVGVGPVEIYSGGLFEPAVAGPPAVWVPCYTRTEDLADLVCFDLKQPTRWWRRLGVVDVLGEINFGRFRVEPAVIHATSLDWLKASGDGFVVIDWALDPVDAFLDAGCLRADPQIRKKLSKRAAFLARRCLERYFDYEG